jgi:hypothetical protein
MSDSCDGDDGSNEEDGDDEENPFAETPVKTNCTGTEYIDSVPAAAVHAAAVAIALPHLPEAAASAVVTADKPVAMEESSQESTRWDGTSSDDDRTLQALEAKEAVSQPWSEEGSGDLSVAPRPPTLRSSRPLRLTTSSRKWTKPLLVSSQHTKN